MTPDRVFAETFECVCEFVANTNAVVQARAELLSGTPEALIDQVDARLLEQSYFLQKVEAREHFNKLSRESFRAVVAHVAAIPAVGIGDAGPHLLFAAAWLRLAVADALARKGRLDDVTKAAFVCCSTLKKWAAAGYRLDWHPMNDDSAGPNRSAPVGSWTVGSQTQPSRTWAQPPPASSLRPPQTPPSTRKWWQLWR